MSPRSTGTFGDEGIAGWRSLTGGEVAETAVEALTEEELSSVSLGEGSWILLEPAPGPLSDSLERRVAHLAERGHRALIAHPERHLSEDMFERMARLVARRGAGPGHRRLLPARAHVGRDAEHCAERA